MAIGMDSSPLLRTSVLTEQNSLVYCAKVQVIAQNRSCGGHVRGSNITIVRAVKSGSPPPARHSDLAGQSQVFPQGS